MAHLRGRDRSRYVARMFSRISPRYDRLNTIMTAGRHYAWRRRAARMAVGDLTGTALDVACGTGDFAIDLAAQSQVTGVVGLDFARPMLPLAVEKSRRSSSVPTDYVAGDAHSLPFPDDSFICVTVGFGVRNFVDLPRALSEMARVLRPGGRLVVLEIVRMEGRGVLPRCCPPCSELSRRGSAPVRGRPRGLYYLPESVQGFVTASEHSRRDGGRGPGYCGAETAGPWHGGHHRSRKGAVKGASPTLGARSPTEPVERSKGIPRGGILRPAPGGLRCTGASGSRTSGTSRCSPASTTRSAAPCAPATSSTCRARPAYPSTAATSWARVTRPPRPTNAMRCVRALLEEAGARMEDICKVTTYVTDASYREQVYAVLAEHLGDTYPTSTGLVVKALAEPYIDFEIDVYASSRRAARTGN